MPKIAISVHARSGIRLTQARHDAEKRGFSGAVGPDDRNERTRIETSGNIAQDLTGPVAHADAAESKAQSPASGPTGDRLP